MLQRRLFFVIVGFVVSLSSFSAGPAWAQAVQGTVLDASTGVPLPAANVHIEGTYQGTITNDEGRFRLPVDPRPATLVVRFIGYETARVAVEADTRTVEVRLAPVTYELDEVVVTDEDPALNIMRKVIERKQGWRDALETYRADAYNRFTLSNDTGIVSVIESVSRTFWDREAGSREVVRSRRQTSNLQLDEYLPAAYFVTNLYDDDVEIAGYRLIGVTHPSALRHYDFSLEGVRSVDGQAVYDIRVAPKNQLKSAFEGRVAVLDSAYALLEVELRPSQAFIFPPPIASFDVTYRQQFSNYGGDFWLPVDFRSTTDLEIRLGALLSFPPFHVDQVARLTDYEVNVPLPDSLYRQKDLVAVDSAAVRSDTVLAASASAIPLTAAEEAAYATIDSTMTLDKAYEPSGALARFIEMEDDTTSRGDGRGLNLPAWLDVDPHVWYNRVEAAHLGLSAEVRLPGAVSAEVEGAYLTGPEDWAYGATLRRTWDGAGRPEAWATYRDEVARMYTAPPYVRGVNSVAMLFGADDYYNYYRRAEAELGASVEWRRMDVSLQGAVRVGRHEAAVRQTSYDLLKGDRRQPPNPAAAEGDLRSVALRLSWGDTEAPLGVLERRGVVVVVEHAPDGLLGSDFDFTRFEVAVDGRIPTLASRRLMPAVLDVRLVAGTFRGTLPVQRWGHVDAAVPPLTPFGVLRTLEGRPYVGRQHAALFWEHNFRTLPFELVGWRGPVRRGYSVLVHGGHGRTWGAEGLEAAGLRGTDGVHHEVGVSLSGLFSLLRLDAAWRLDEPGFAVGVGVARIF